MGRLALCLVALSQLYGLFPALHTSTDLTLCRSLDHAPVPHTTALSMSHVSMSMPPCYLWALYGASVGPSSFCSSALCVGPKCHQTHACVRSNDPLLGLNAVVAGPPWDRHTLPLYVPLGRKLSCCSGVGLASPRAPTPPCQLSKGRAVVSPSSAATGQRLRARPAGLVSTLVVRALTRADVYLSISSRKQELERNRQRRKASCEEWWGAP